MCAPKCGGFTPSPNPRDVSRARQRRSTWLRNILPISRLRLPSCLKGGRENLPYSCGTAPDSNRLRLFSPGIRTMGTPDVQYSVADSIQAGTGSVQMRLPRGTSQIGGKRGQGGMHGGGRYRDPTDRSGTGQAQGLPLPVRVGGGRFRGMTRVNDRRHRRSGGCAARGG